MMSIISYIAVAASLAALSAHAAPLPDKEIDASSDLTCASILRPGTMSTMSCHCTASCVNEGLCCKDYEQFTAGMTSFMQTKSMALVRDGAQTEPMDFHKSQVVITATVPLAASKVAPKGSTLLVARNCAFEDKARAAPHPPRDGQVTTQVMPKWEVGVCQDGFDVVAYTAHGAFVAFEDAVAVPSKVRVALGELPPAQDQMHVMVHPYPWNVLYYAEVGGDSATAAYKMALAGQKPISTLRAALPKAPRGKLAWDPTPSRRWALEQPELGLDGLVAVDFANVPARDLDGGYSQVAARANFQLTATSTGYLRKIWNGKEWTDVLDQFGEPIAVTSL